MARKLINVSQEYSIPLIVGVIAGLIVANIDNHFYEKLADHDVFGEATKLFGHELTVHFFINSVFMVFFFGIAAKEITDAALPGGSLNPLRKAINPLLGTLGGVLGPAGVYFLLAFVIYGGSDDFSDVSNGWAIPTATDIALAWLVARVVFGRLHPAVSFLLLIAVADDAIGLGIIAIFYPRPDAPVAPVWLSLTVGGMAVAYGMRRLKVRSWIPYIAIGGVLSWLGLLKAAIEPALALVVIVPFLPGPSSDGPKEIESPPTGHALRHSPLEQFEHHLKLFVDVGLFFFAFANAGVPLSSINEVTAIVLISLIGGKTFGITLFSWAAYKIGFPLPSGMGMKHLAVAGLIAGLGLTVALFVAEKAFPEPPFDNPAKMGAVLSASVALLAFIAGAALKVKDDGGSAGQTP